MSIVNSVVSNVVTPVVTSVASLNPILHMPLINGVNILTGVGSATFTSASTRSYVDRIDGLIKTVSANVARFEAQGYLVESDGTNLTDKSEEFDDAAWGKTAGATATADQAVSPDGTTNADLLDISASNSYINNFITSVSSTEYTFSLYLRSVSGTGTWPINWYDGSSHHRELVNLTTTWQRFSITFTPGTTNPAVYPGDSRLASTLTTCYAWGVQYEAGASPSSYIKTTTAPVTRLADNLSIDSDNIPVPTADYSVTFDFDVNGSKVADEQTLYNVTAETDRYARTGIDLIDLGVKHGATAFNDSTAITAGQTIKFAHVVDVSDSSTGQKLYRDGVLTTGAVTSVTGTKTAIEIGRNGSGDYLNGHIKNLKIFDKALTASEVSTL